MSNNTNDGLLEEANFYMDYFTSTIMEKMLAYDIETNDLESLAVHLKECRDIVFKNEYHVEATDVY